MAGDGRRRSAASSSASPSCAGARALGVAAAVARPRRLRAPRLRRPGDHPPLHDARRRDPGDLRRRSACSAGGCSSRGHPWRRRWQVFAGARRADVRRLGCRTSRTSTRGSTPTSPTRRGSRATSPTSSTSGAFEPLCGRSRSPTTAPSPASPSASTCRPTRDRQRQRGSASPGRGYFVDPASPFVIHNFILDPNDPTRLRHPSPPRLRPRRPQRVLALYRRC